MLNLPIDRQARGGGHEISATTSRRGFLASAATAGIGFGATADSAQTKPTHTTNEGQSTADRFQTKDGTVLYFKDWGSGPAVVFSHGYPLSSDAWEDQMFFLVQNGYRVIAHDRRGFGRSSQPSTGNMTTPLPMISRSW